ncbi:MAG: T9SS type A sorting domain-containing protein [Saprospiraceae bacterium]|nr:T9SS type A sorting domain-containing protein [Saprospiraceae bacterium]
MKGKYFTLSVLFFLSFSLSAQRINNNATKEAGFTKVTPVQKSTYKGHSYLTKIETKTNNPAPRSLRKLALVEEFTNASCGPCAAQNPAFNTLIDGNEGKVVAIKYQVWFPGYDPMYETNKSEVQAKWSIYEDYTIGLYGSDNGLGGVPTAFLDGYMGNGTYGGGNWSQAYYGAPAGYNQAAFNFASGNDSPLDISVTHAYNQTVDSVNITVTVTNNADTTYNISKYNLHTYILESKLNWPSAPGSNGEKDFSHVFRKAASDIYGDNVLPASLDSGASSVYTYSVALKDYFFALNQIEVVAFIQNTENLSVMNAAISEPVAFPTGTAVGDPAVSNISKSNGSFCPEDYTAEPIIKVSNNNPDQSDITQVTASYSLNGAEVIKEFDTDIKYGASTELSFGAIPVSGGKNTIKVRIISFNNGAIDGNLINNITNDYSFVYLSEVGTAAPKSYTNEGDGDLNNTLFMSDPAFPYIFTISPDQLNTPNNVGGYANSANSLLLYFFQWNPQSTSPSMSVITDKINMPANPVFTYDWAYAGYIENGVKYDNDKVEFGYSTDCGATFKTFKTLSGQAMKTAGDKTTFFIPKSTEWRTDSINLPELANTNDVVFQIKVTSNWGNAGYLDNIFVGESAVIATNNINSFENVSVYPNPTTDVLNIRINASQPSTANVSVMDYTGKLVKTLNTNQNITNGANNLSFNVSSLTNGTYLVKIENKEGVNIQRFTVIK